MGHYLRKVTTFIRGTVLYLSITSYFTPSIPSRLILKCNLAILQLKIPRYSILHQHISPIPESGTKRPVFFIFSYAIAPSYVCSVQYQSIWRVGVVEGMVRGCGGTHHPVSVLNDCHGCTRAAFASRTSDGRLPL